MDTSTPVLREEPVLVDLAKKHNRSPALIALRYQLQRGVVVLAKSFTQKHIKENLQVNRQFADAVNQILMCTGLGETLGAECLFIPAL